MAQTVCFGPSVTRFGLIFSYNSCLLTNCCNRLVVSQFPLSVLSREEPLCKRFSVKESIVHSQLSSLFLSLVLFFFSFFYFLNPISKKVSDLESNLHGRQWDHYQASKGCESSFATRDDLTTGGTVSMGYQI